MSHSLFSIVLLLVATLGPLYRLRVEIGAVDGSFSRDQLVTATFATLAIGAALCSPTSQASTQWRVNPGLLAATALWVWLLCSAWWSGVPTLSLTEALTAGMGLVAARYLATQWTVRELGILVWSSTTIGVLVSLIAVVRHWSFSRDGNGDWTGIYFNRNSLAPVAAIAVISGIWLICSTVRRGVTVRELVGAGGVMVAVVLAGRTLVGSGGKTALLGVGFTLSIGLLAAVSGRYLAPRSASRVVSGAITLLVTAALVGYRPVAERLGSSPSLEGRTVLWEKLFDGFRQHPWTGTGWMATYHLPWFEAWRERNLSQVVETAHNGFVEVLAGTGIIGAALLLTLMVWSVRSATLQASRRFDACLFPLLITVFAVVANATETFVGSFHMIWIVLLAAAAFRWEAHPVSENGNE